MTEKYPYLKHLTKDGLSTYVLDPVLKEQLVVRTAEMILSRCPSGCDQSTHLELRAQLHDNLTRKYSELDETPLLQTANEIVVQAMRLNNDPAKRGKLAAALGLPPAMEEICQRAFEKDKIWNEKTRARFVAVVRALIFSGENEANTKAHAYARAEIACFNPDFPSKAELAKITKFSEGLLSEAKRAVILSRLQGQDWNADEFNLDDKTRRLVKALGYSAKLIREGKVEKLRKDIAKNPVSFKSCGAADLIVQMMVSGVPAIDEAGVNLNNDTYNFSDGM